MTDTENEIREFATVEPIDATPEMARFITAMRRLQDIAVSTNPDATLWTDAAERIEDVCARLEEHKAPQASRLPAVPRTSPASAIRWCRRGGSLRQDPTGSPCTVTSAASMSAATTQSTAG